MYRTTECGSIAGYFEYAGSTEIRYKRGEFAINMLDEDVILFSTRSIFFASHGNNYSLYHLQITMNHIVLMQVFKAFRNSFHLKKIALRLKVHAIKVSLTIASLVADDALVGSEKKVCRSPKVQRGATIPVEGIAGSSSKPNKGSTFGWRRPAQRPHSFSKFW